MSSEKGIFVNAITEGQAVEGVFLVKELNRGETRAGKPFLRLTVMDKSGEIGGPVWDDAEGLAPLCQPGSYIRINGQGDSYQGRPQLKINRISPVAADQIALTDFMPGGNFDPQALAAELDALIATVTNPHLRRLLQAIFIDDRELRRLFSTAPAAKVMHHAYLGGLLEHTLAVARLARAISDLYPTIDRDLLLAGALLHDLGKTVELTYEGYPFGYSNRGRLVGHLVIGAETVAARAGQIPDFPPELLECLQHLILSHHGRHEFGAPTLPMMQEAFILHFLDDLDAKVNYFARLGQQAPEPGYQWSDFQRNLERFLFLKGPEEPPDATARSQSEDEEPAAAPPPGRNSTPTFRLAGGPTRKRKPPTPEEAGEPASDKPRQTGLFG